VFYYKRIGDTSSRRFVAASVDTTRVYQCLSGNPEMNNFVRHIATGSNSYLDIHQGLTVRNLIVAIIVFAISSGPARIALALVRTVALTGQSAPADPAGAYTSFSLPLINNAGQVGFIGGVNDIEGVWSEGGGSLAQIARGVGSGLTSPAIADNGDMSFYGTIAGETGIWVGKPGSLRLVAKVGGPAPGAPGSGTFSAFDDPFRALLNDVGKVAFLAHATTAPTGVWSEGTGTLSLTARVGEQAAGTDPGMNYTSFSLVRFNDSGQTAFHGYYEIRSARNAIWVDTAGSTQLVARTGMQAPGLPAGALFSTIDIGSNGILGFNNDGDVAFVAVTSGGGPVVRGIWSGGAGDLGLVASTGESAPGLPSGATFTSILTGSNDVMLNNEGDVAFLATVSGPGITSANNTGLWVGERGSLELVARTGDHAPGTPNGVTFSTFSGATLLLNDAGQIAIRAGLTGTGVNNTNNLGIWATDRSGILRLIARTGDLLEISPGEFRTIASDSSAFPNFWGGAGNNDGRRSSFNDLGELVFRAGFSDGSSGIFVSDLATVPEPSIIALALSGVILMLPGSRCR
jgi:hypothetical protein